MDYVVSERWSLPQRYCSMPLSILPETPELVTILRMLSGTTRITNQDDGQTYEVDVNFLSPGDGMLENNIDVILAYLFEVVPDLDELTSLFVSFRTANRAFYKEIHDEVLLCLVAINSERFTEAFLYIYRLIERLSAATPLLYVAKEKEFSSAHKLLSAMFSDSKNIGELGMLQRLLRQFAADDSNFAQNTLDFALPGSTSAFSRAVLSEMRDAVLPEVNDMSLDDAVGVITVPFPAVASFLITVRNRTFHNMPGRRNINVAKIGGVEPMFALLVPQLLYWFSYLLVEFAKWQIERQAAWK